MRWTIRCAGCSSPSAWPISTTSTRSTAPTGSTTGAAGARCCAWATAARWRCPRRSAGRRGCGTACWRRSTRAAGARCAATCTGASSRRSRRATRRASRCRAGWCCSGTAICRGRRWRRWWRCRSGRRCCWRYPIPAASTGPTSSTAASCCARCGGASRCAAGWTWPRSRSTACTRMRIRCWPPGAGRGATSSACSTASTMRPPRSRASRCRASTCSTRTWTRPTIRCAACRCWCGCSARSATACRCPRSSSARPPHRRWPRTTDRSASRSRTARCARSRSCTTGCWTCWPSRRRARTAAPARRWRRATSS